MPTKIIEKELCNGVPFFCIMNYLLTFETWKEQNL